jgi:hypothetical protein
VGRRVVVVASGETERKSLPILLRETESVSLEVRIPGGHRQLTAEMARRLIRAAWFGTEPEQRPDKFVVLVDADAGSEHDAEARLHDVRQLGDEFRVPILVTAAKWHLEAWFFADEQELRKHLGRSLGLVDASNPDAIQNPKQRLEGLLDGIYTARVAEEIAGTLRPRYLRRSNSFAKFEDSVLNGGPSPSAGPA